jgi:hypothetical protein
MMGHIIQFPTGSDVTVQEPAEAKASIAPPLPPSSVVTALKKRARVPKQNREEDKETIFFARFAKGFAESAHQLAETEPDGMKQRTMEISARAMRRKLPRNNLRVFSTPEDVREGLTQCWRRVRIANLEWELCDERRIYAAFGGDSEGEAFWSEKQTDTDRKRWLEYERLIRVPATSLSSFNRYKLSKEFRCIGNIEWMRQWKPELAAILDEEHERLSAESAARRTARVQKKEALR